MTGDIPAIVAVPACVGLVALAIIGLDWVQRQALAAEEEARAHGDVIELHPEVKARGGSKLVEAGGRGSRGAAPAQVRTSHIAHDEGAASR